MDELLAQFLIEGRDLVADAHDSLRVLAGGEANAASIDSLFRAIHTLKGSVAIFDMAPAEDLLHAAETRLDAVRKGREGLPKADAQSLVRVIDQIDRWIDSMEIQGALSGDAEDIARDLKGPLGLAGDLPAQGSATNSDWLSAALARPLFASRIPDSGGTAFRMEPDADCFFRGEDPLAVVAAVPGLLAFELLPNGEWPDLDSMEPYRCVSAIEGLSSDDFDSVHAAFRLFHDQVSILRIGNDRRTGSAIGGRIEDNSATLRVVGSKLDRLARNAGDLSIAIHGLGVLATRADELDRSFAADLRRIQATIEGADNALRTSIAEVRLVSLAPVLRRLPRLARETAADLGKEIEFTIVGESIEADKQIADAIFEPLLHLVRNAIDHGIETPEERVADGKASVGAIALTLEPRGDRLIVTLKDDGRGLDLKRLSERAVATGQISAETAAGLTDTQCGRLIFLPGLSTAKKISDLSGRGVGMDVVRTIVDRLQGSVDVESRAGSGTTIRLSLPLNAISTQLLTVSASDHSYGLRLDQITETLRVQSTAIQPVGQGEACVIRDRTVPVIDLAKLLGGEPVTSETARLVVTEVTGEPIALRVNALGGRLDAIVRSPAGLLDSVPAVGGTAVLADGAVLLVLDLLELVG